MHTLIISAIQSVLLFYTFGNLPWTCNFSFLCEISLYLWNTPVTNCIQMRWTVCMYVGGGGVIVKQAYKINLDRKCIFLATQLWTICRTVGSPSEARPWQNHYFTCVVFACREQNLREPKILPCWETVKFDKHRGKKIFCRLLLSLALSPYRLVLLL